MMRSGSPPSAQAVGPRELRTDVADPHVHDPVLVEGVLLLDLRAAVGEALDGDALEVLVVRAQRWVEGEQHVAEGEHVAARLAVVADGAALDEPEVADVVRRAVTAAHRP